MKIQSTMCSAVLAMSLSAAAVAAGAPKPADPSWVGQARQKVSQDVIAVVSPESFAARFSRKALPQKEAYTYKFTQWADDGVVFEVHKYDGRTIGHSLDEKTLHSVGFYHAATDKVNWPIE